MQLLIVVVIASLQEARKRMEEKRERKLENERKGEIVQKVRKNLPYIALWLFNTHWFVEARALVCIEIYLCLVHPPCRLPVQPS